MKTWKIWAKAAIAASIAWSSIACDGAQAVPAPGVYDFGMGWLPVIQTADLSAALDVSAITADDVEYAAPFAAYSDGHYLAAIATIDKQACNDGMGNFVVHSLPPLVLPYVTGDGYVGILGDSLCSLGRMRERKYPRRR